MIETTAVLGVAAAALGLVLTPGPNMMYLVSRTVSQGRRAGLISQFVVTAHGRVWLQSLCLGSIQIAIAISVNGLIVLSAGAIAGFLAGRPLWLRIQRFVTGSVLGAMAVLVVSDRARPMPA
ncbi:hypothetical protein ACIP5Y_35915 [Nocardia sp. NPDC088792]|uniref:hypothetical protein n=1 Tax=Nocardia sp. NPDC088792 TaxID=3364332 RepID=UPI003820E726